MSRSGTPQGEPSGAPSPSESLRQRELEIASEIAQAFLTATRPLEVYRLALARVTPLVDASFSSVFLRDPADPSLLKLVCAQNWPQSSARFLSQLRIRVGRGPTGRAVAEHRAVEVQDVFADPALREWWDPARELGFTSLISLPLALEGEVSGALTFYFDAAHAFEDHERTLLALVARQLAATVERAHLIEKLQTANAELHRQKDELEYRVREAEQAKRLKTEFLANISHELRTPLTSILGYTFLLDASHMGALTTDQQAAVRKIDRAATVLLRLINDLLDLSQLSLGRTALAEQEEEAVALVHRAADIVGPPPAGVEFRVECPDGAIPLRVDGEKVAKVLENLLSNAFKFTAQGEVVVTVRRTGTPEHGAPAVEWAVRDTGIGIRAHDQHAIFDEFRQVDGSSTRLYGGTGLGLALSRRLGELLGGEIRVSSEPAVGSTFTFRVPLRS
ncbi:MAG TPA: ATP-binding protein [Longimicrobiales bacterium]|nr:ATP-binding protein [Longimicrobiales bacterium]